MYCMTRIIALASSFIALAATAQTPAVKSDITDLAYSVQSGDNIYFTGKYQSKLVYMVRQGVIGTGKWTIYSGSPSNRVRLTMDDRRGLREILAMDTGQRMTLNQVGQERIEYRLYAPDRKFIIGSVIYRHKGRWLQGLMMTEAFEGYPALADVADVTKKFHAQADLPAAKLAGWLKDRWDQFDLIPMAEAQEGASTATQVKRLFNVSQDFLDGPVAHEMMKGQLIGGAAFTLKLVQVGGGMPAVLELVGSGAAAAAALPMLQVAVIGIGAVVVVSKVYDAGENFYSRVLKAKDLGNSTSVKDFFTRLVTPTKYEVESEEEAPASREQLRAASPKSQTKGAQRPADAMKLLAEQSALMDADEFREELDLAAACTRNRDYACSENHLKKAGKVANGPADNQLLAEARGNMSKQKELVAEEARARAEAERKRTEYAAFVEQKRVEEEKRVANAERQRSQQAAAAPSAGFQWGKALAMGAAASASGLGKLSSEVKINVVKGIIQDSMPGQTGASNSLAGIQGSKGAMAGGGGDVGTGSGGGSKSSSDPVEKAASSACSGNDPALIGAWRFTTSKGASLTLTFDGCNYAVSARQPPGQPLCTKGTTGYSGTDSYTARGGLLTPMIVPDTYSNGDAAGICLLLSPASGTYRISGASLIISNKKDPFTGGTLVFTRQ